MEDAISVINTSVEQSDKANELMKDVTESYSDIVELMVGVSLTSKSVLNSSLDSQSSADEVVNSLNAIPGASGIPITKSNILIS